MEATITSQSKVYDIVTTFDGAKFWHVKNIARDLLNFSSDQVETFSTECYEKLRDLINAKPKNFFSGGSFSCMGGQVNGTVVTFVANVMVTVGKTEKYKSYVAVLSYNGDWKFTEIKLK